MAAVHSEQRNVNLPFRKDSTEIWRESREIRNKHDVYKDWITDTVKTGAAPSIRLLLVFGNYDTLD